MVNITYVDMLVISELRREKLAIKLYAKTKDGKLRFEVTLPELFYVNDNLVTDFIIGYLNSFPQHQNMFFDIVAIEGLDEYSNTKKLFKKDKENKEHVLVRVK